MFLFRNANKKYNKDANNKKSNTIKKRVNYVFLLNHL